MPDQADYWQKILAIVIWKFTKSDALRVTAHDVSAFHTAHPEERMVLMTHDPADDSVNLLIGGPDDLRKLLDAGKRNRGPLAPFAVVK